MNEMKVVSPGRRGEAGGGEVVTPICPQSALHSGYGLLARVLAATSAAGRERTWTNVSSANCVIAEDIEK